MNKKTQELAKRIRQERNALGLNGDTQQGLLRRLREAFELSNEELAQALEMNEHTLKAYLAPGSAKKHRVMPEADRLVLSKIVATKRHR